MTEAQTPKAEESTERLQHKPGGRRRFTLGLSGKLLFLTVLFVMISEVLIFVPSVSNYRKNWLSERLARAQVAVRVLATTDKAMISETEQMRLLEDFNVLQLAIRSGGRRQIITASPLTHTIDQMLDIRGIDPLTSISDTFATLFSADEARIIRVVGHLEMQSGLIELVINDRQLRDDLLLFARNILLLSLFISILTAGLVYISLHALIVRPIRRISDNMTAFSNNPDDHSRIITPSTREDEIGQAEMHLADMEQHIATTLKQQRHLADLGLAVSKINHDLRNMLASAQLLSDRLVMVPDPTVQRFAPKLIKALDRAIDFAESTLTYGKAREEPPKRRLIHLQPLVEDVAAMTGVHEAHDIEWRNQVDEALEIDADPDHLHRVLTNLCRNAKQALETLDGPHDVRRICVQSQRTNGAVTIAISDTGPGIPDKARGKLFQAFQGSHSKGGTGLGLAISAELIRAHGGTITVLDKQPGAHFEIFLPDSRV